MLSMRRDSVAVQGFRSMLVQNSLDVFCENESDSRPSTMPL